MTITPSMTSGGPHERAPSDIHKAGRCAPLPTALAPLIAERRWLVWRWETNNQGKRTKVPYRAKQPGVKASSTNPGTWSDYATALETVEAHQADGIGFALHESDFAAFDCDDCRDPDTGAIEPWSKRRGNCVPPGQRNCVPGRRP